MSGENDLKTFEEIIESNLIGLTRGSSEQSPSKKYRYVKMNNITRDNRFNFSDYTCVDATADEVKKFNLKSGDFLFNTRNSHELVGKTCVFESRSDDVILFNNNIMRVRFKKGVIPAYVNYAFTSKPISEQLEKLKSGTTNVSAIYYKDLKNLRLPIPSFSKQERIVAILNDAFAAIDKAKANVEKNLQNAKEFFESYLQNIFTNNADNWTHDSVENLVLNKILDKPLDGNHGEIHPTKSDFVKEGIPFIMASDLYDGQVDLTNCKFIRKEQAKKLRKGFAQNADVLLSHKGTIGRVAILKTNDDYVVLTPQVTYYRVLDDRKLKNEFLYYYFLSPIFQKQMIEGAEGGATRAYIGITKQLNLQVAFPSSLNEQEVIIKNLKSIEAKTKGLWRLYQNKLNDLEELKKSILQEAFAGKLITKAVLEI